MAIRLSKLALADLEDIRRYTIGTWGHEQWLTYYRKLLIAFERISENPEAGRDRSLFVRGMRSLNCEHHVILYQRLKAAGDAPVILRVVHLRRHMPALVYYEDLDSGG